MILELPDIEPELSAADLRLELACSLYAHGRIGAVSGAELAGTDLFTFQSGLRDRGIPQHYTEEDLQDDTETIRKIFPV